MLRRYGFYGFPIIVENCFLKCIVIDSKVTTDMWVLDSYENTYQVVLLPLATYDVNLHTCLFIFRGF